ncbi:unnamed protein product [Prorocentrum cordatum]|uniref:Uncharacterized protein n=1 Tax=Prorocentrum cordatum TaxID=2364126 RepID=A0ABN9X307_9DINO|nr:unnamed protein product [Polarella glacialis]
MSRALLFGHVLPGVLDEVPNRGNPGLRADLRCTDRDGQWVYLHVAIAHPASQQSLQNYLGFDEWWGVKPSMMEILVDWPRKGLERLSADLAGHLGTLAGDARLGHLSSDPGALTDRSSQVSTEQDDGAGGRALSAALGAAVALGAAGHTVRWGAWAPARPGGRAWLGGQRAPGAPGVPRCAAAANGAAAVADAGVTDGDAAYLEKKEALKKCLAREYRSFFQPFESEFYSEAVTFTDPLNNLEGKEAYGRNVAMLSGESFVGNILFSDGYIDLHSVEDVPGDDRRLRTRWTLGFTFKLLPWAPKALFTGVSEYVIDGDAMVLSQRDYWDTLSLGSGGSYEPEAPLAGAAELVAQLLPRPLRPAAAEEPPAAQRGGWALLRRARDCRVYRTGAAGRVVAVPAPGDEASLEDLERALKRQGLRPGAALRVLPDGRVEEGQAGRPGGAGLGVEVLGPHPWDGEPPPAAPAPYCCAPPGANTQPEPGIPTRRFQTRGGATCTHTCTHKYVC